MGGVIKTIARNYAWASPEKLGSMYCDARDDTGLVFWYDDVAEQVKQAEAQYPKK